MAGTLAATVTYFKHEGVPGDYFECAYYGSMSVSACARNFTDAPQSMRAGRLQKCLGCAVGRKHSGSPDEAPRVPVSTAIAYRVACVRCRRDGRTAGTRLIGRLRLVRGHTICVSCYNREREVLTGANAKGARPKKWGGLFVTRAAFVAGARTVVLEYPHPVVDRVELALTMIRTGHSKGVAWARSSIVRDIPQVDGGAA